MTQREACAIDAAIRVFHHTCMEDKILSLEARITELQEIGSRLVTSRQALRENIARNLLARGHTALALEVREMKLEHPTNSEAQLTLPGWMCGSCGVFNGEAKKKLLECRSCSTPRSC